jgi:hypothetical protein
MGFAATGGLILDVATLRRAFAAFRMHVTDEALVDMVHRYTSCGPVAVTKPGLPFARRMMHADFVALCAGVLETEDREDRRPGGTESKEQHDAFAALAIDGTASDSTAAGSPDHSSKSEFLLGADPVANVNSKPPTEAAAAAPTVRFADDEPAPPAAAPPLHSLSRTQLLQSAPNPGRLRLGALEAFFSEFGLPSPPRLAHMRAQRAQLRDAAVRVQQAQSNNVNAQDASTDSLDEVALKISWDDFLPLVAGRANDADGVSAINVSSASSPARRSLRSSSAPGASAMSHAGDRSQHSLGGAGSGGSVGPSASIDVRALSAADESDEPAWGAMNFGSFHSRGSFISDDNSDGGFFGGARHSGHDSGAAGTTAVRGVTPCLDSADPSGKEARLVLRQLQDALSRHQLPPIPATLREPKRVQPLFVPRASSPAAVLSKPGETPRETPEARRLAQSTALAKLTDTGPRAFRDNDPRYFAAARSGLGSAALSYESTPRNAPLRLDLTALVKPSVLEELGVTLLTPGESDRYKPTAEEEHRAQLEREQLLRERHRILQRDEAANAAIERIFQTASTLGFLAHPPDQSRRDRDKWRATLDVMRAPVHPDREVPPPALPRTFPGLDTLKKRSSQRKRLQNRSGTQGSTIGTRAAATPQPSRGAKTL